MGERPVNPPAGDHGTDARSTDHSPPPHRPGDSQSPPDEPNDMISGRGETERDDDAPPEIETFEE